MLDVMIGDTYISLQSINNKLIINTNNNRFINTFLIKNEFIFDNVNENWYISYDYEMEQKIMNIMMSFLTSS